VADAQGQEEEEEDFYDAQSPASQIKTRIVTKYFGFWSGHMVGVLKRTGGKSLAYMDFYCGPGTFKDGSPSTPVLILREAAKSPDLRERLVTLFNDKEQKHIDKLVENIAAVPNIEGLANKPIVSCSEVGKAFEDHFATTSIVPTFTFVDPFGYKGVTLKLLQAMLKDWGCDLVLFFSYNRINAALTNNIVEDHITALFGGKDRVAALVKSLEGKKPAEREVHILESFSRALKDMGFKFVLPFSFMQPKRKRTSHYLIFVCKDKLGYKVMKEIMAKESSENDQGVASFGYVPALSEEQTPLLFELTRPLDELGALLLKTYAGKKMTTKEIYDDHNVDKPFTLKNYKDALKALLAEGKIATERVPKKGTFADDILVEFPAKEG
jgi:three-Cys-motif partner protein